MNLAGTLALMTASALLAAVLPAVRKRYPKAKYWYGLFVALVFIGLASSLVRDTIRYRETVGWVLAVLSGGFGIVMAGAAIHGLYQPPLRPAPHRDGGGIQRRLIWLGLGIGAAVPWTLWFASAYFVSVLALAIGRTSALAGAVDVVLAYLIIAILARPVIRDARLTEAVAALPCAARRPLCFTLIIAFAIGAIVSMIAVGVWDRFWFGARSPFIEAAGIQGMGLRIVVLAGLLFVTGLAAYFPRRVPGDAQG